MQAEAFTEMRKIMDGCMAKALQISMDINGRYYTWMILQYPRLDDVVMQQI